MVGHGGSSAGSYLADPTSPIISHCESIGATSTLRVNSTCFIKELIYTDIHQTVMVRLECSPVHVYVSALQTLMFRTVSTGCDYLGHFTFPAAAPLDMLTQGASQISRIEWRVMHKFKGEQE